MKLVIKNPPHTAHISQRILKECSLTLLGTRALLLSLSLQGKLTLKYNSCCYNQSHKREKLFYNLNGHKSNSTVLSLTPMSLLATTLKPLKHSATNIREARVQAQEVGVNNCTRFSQGDIFCGYLGKTFIERLVDCHNNTL